MSTRQQEHEEQEADAIGAAKREGQEADARMGDVFALEHLGALAHAPELLQLRLVRLGLRDERGELPELLVGAPEVLSMVLLEYARVVLRSERFHCREVKLACDGIQEPVYLSGRLLQLKQAFLLALNRHIRHLQLAQRDSAPPSSTVSTCEVEALVRRSSTSTWISSTLAYSQSLRFGRHDAVLVPWTAAPADPNSSPSCSWQCEQRGLDGRGHAVGEAQETGKDVLK